jgi:uncharacterized protein YndB with AHSA1/START domain
MSMTSSRPAKVTLPTDDEILITRDFDAPRHLVYKAWTTPELVRRWWAGRRGEMKIVDIDLRVGGMWRYVMVAHGDFEVAFHGEFREIVPDERLVYTEVYEGPGGELPPGMEPPLNTAMFAEADGRTTLTLLTECPSRDVRDAIVDSGMETGLQEQMDVLEELAASLR